MSLYYWAGTFISWATVETPNHRPQILYSLGKLAFKQALSETISQEVLISEFLPQDN